MQNWPIWRVVIRCMLARRPDQAIWACLLLLKPHDDAQVSLRWQVLAPALNLSDSCGTGTGYGARSLSHAYCYEMMSFEYLNMAPLGLRLLMQFPWDPGERIWLGVLVDYSFPR